jgi:hypothetical protein
MDSSHPNKEERPLGSAYIPYVKGVSKKFKYMGINSTLRHSSKLNTLLGDHIQKPGWKEIRNITHSVPIAFPVNVA